MSESYIYKKLRWLENSVSYLLSQGTGGTVSTVFGRSGTVTAQNGDYTFAQISSTPTTLAGYGIANPVIPSGEALSIFNTADQVTNYERFRIYWTSNMLNIRTEQGGTGANRNLVIGPANTTLTMFASANTVGFFNFFTTTSTANATGVSIAGTASTWNASSGVNTIFGIGNHINQSGTAGFRGIFVSPYVQATGSGIKLLMDLGVNTAVNYGGTHTSRFKVSNVGLVSMTVPTEYADDTAAKAGGLVVGDIYKTGSVLKIVVS